MSASKYPNLTPWRTRERPPEDPRAPPKGPPALTRDETLRWWATVQNDYWWKTEMPLSCKMLSGVLGVGQWQAAAALMRGLNATNTLASLARLIPHIEARRIVFPQPVASGTKGRQRLPPPLWLTPPDQPPIIPRLAPACSWNLFTRCRSCGGNKWLPVIVDNKDYVACYACLPPPLWKSLAARLSPKRLIAEACQKL